MTFTLCPFFNAISNLNLLKDKGSPARGNTAKSSSHYTSAVLPIEGLKFSPSPKMLTTCSIPSNVSAVHDCQTAFSFCIVPFQGKPDDYEPEDEDWIDEEDDDRDFPINGED